MNRFEGFSTWSGKRYVIGEYSRGHVVTEIVWLVNDSFEVWSGCDLVEIVPTHRISATHYRVLASAEV